MSPTQETEPHTPDRPTRRHIPLPWRIAAIVALALVALAFWPRGVDPYLESLGRDYLEDNHANVAWDRGASQRGLPGLLEQVTFTGLRHGTQAITAVVSYSRSGGSTSVREAKIYLGHGSALPVWMWFVTLGLVAGTLIYVFFYKVPQTFGRRCPRDHSMLKRREVVVKGRMYDRSGITLASIIERWDECPQCDFQHVEAMSDPLYRPAGLVKGVAGGPYAHFAQERVDRMLEQLAREGVTKEEYDQLMVEAKDAARAKCSSDSPWLRR